MTTTKALQVYLNWKKTHTVSAFNAYKVRITQFLDFISPKSCLQDISGDDVVAFHRYMEQHYSPATIAYSARILKNFFWFWHGRQETNLNPKEIIPIKFINADKDIVLASDFEDMTDLLDERFYTDLQKKLVLHLLWDTGMRVSELMDIKLKDIGSKGKNNLRTAKVRTRKTMRYNLVVWGARTDELLDSYLGLRLCIDNVESDQLFINPKTRKPYTTRSVQRWVKELANLAGIDKNITPHSFRHGKANEVLSKGGDMRDVSAILRHASLHSTIKYAQLCPERYLQSAGKFLQTA